MLRNIVAAFAALFIVNLASVASSTELHLDFRQFPAKVYTGQPASLHWNNDVVSADYFFRYDQLDGEPALKTAERVYRQAAADMKQRFAGHYVIISRGCGTGIRCAYMVDLRTGMIAATLESETAGYKFRADSRLLVVNVDVPQPDEYHLHRYLSTAYYLWTGESLELIAEDAWPETRVVSEIVAPEPSPLRELAPAAPTKYKLVKVRKFDPTDPSIPDRVQIPTPRPDPDLITGSLSR